MSYNRDKKWGQDFAGPINLAQPDETSKSERFENSQLAKLINNMQINEDKKTQLLNAPIRFQLEYIANKILDRSVMDLVMKASDALITQEKEGNIANSHSMLMATFMMYFTADAEVKTSNH